MSDFERSGDRTGVTYDEPARRRKPGTFFADLGDRLARGFNSFDRPQPDDGDWEEYEEFDQPTEAVDSIQASDGRRRFQTVLHGYDCEAVDELRGRARAGDRPARRAALGGQTVTLLSDRCRARARRRRNQRDPQGRPRAGRGDHSPRPGLLPTAASPTPPPTRSSMTEDANRRFASSITETDAVWAERVRLIDDVRNVATSLFSLAEDASDRFPEDGDHRGGATMAEANRCHAGGAEGVGDLARGGGGGGGGGGWGGGGGALGDAPPATRAGPRGGTVSGSLRWRKPPPPPPPPPTPPPPKQGRPC